MSGFAADDVHMRGQTRHGDAVRVADDHDHVVNVGAPGNRLPAMAHLSFTTLNNSTDRWDAALM